MWYLLDIRKQVSVCVIWEKGHVEWQCNVLVKEPQTEPLCPLLIIFFCDLQPHRSWNLTTQQLSYMTAFKSGLVTRDESEDKPRQTGNNNMAQVGFGRPLWSKQHMMTKGCGMFFLLPMLIKHRSFATQFRPHFLSGECILNICKWASLLHRWSYPNWVISVPVAH